MLLSSGANIQSEDLEGTNEKYMHTTRKLTIAIIGKTPLHIATVYQHEQAAHLLVEKGAETDVKDKDGLTPTDIAPRQWLAPKGIYIIISLLLMT